VTLEEAGVAIWSYRRRRPYQRADESDEVTATAAGLVDEMHKRQASTRGREAMRAKARQGHVARRHRLRLPHVREAGHV
jgi:hypothetical protein